MIQLSKRDQEILDLTLENMQDLAKDGLLDGKRFSGMVERFAAKGCKDKTTGLPITLALTADGKNVEPVIAKRDNRLVVCKFKGYDEFAGKTNGTPGLTLDLDATKVTFYENTAKASRSSLDDGKPAPRVMDLASLRDAIVEGLDKIIADRLAVAASAADEIETEPAE